MAGAIRALEDIPSFRMIGVLRAEGRLTEEEADACRVALSAWYGFRPRDPERNVSQEPMSPVSRMSPALARSWARMPAKQSARGSNRTERESVSSSPARFRAPGDGLS
mgnify:FL=1